MRLAFLLLLIPAGCSTVDLGSELAPPGLCQPDKAYFTDVIWPEYLSPPDASRSCVVSGGCHDADNSPRSGMRLETDIASPGVLDRDYDVVTTFLTCGDPMGSPLLIYPLAGIQAHEGGEIFPDRNDPAVSAFESWFP